ncbi:MAG: IS5 family transposase [Bacteroidetes bacterium]|nr:IS5 family transposase [Bacteroidota bacterium]
MIRYKSFRQISIEEFKTPFEIRLDKENRWVRLARIIPWDDLAGIYYKNLSKERGAPTIDARIVIGAMIVKHKLGLDDRETIETIKENMYIQYFLGLSEYKYEEVFDRSLFTALRYRMGVEQFDAMSGKLISRAESSKTGQKKKEDTKQDNSEEKKADQEEAQVPMKNQGKLLLDATVADQMIVYPTDLGLVSKSREESERIIDLLCQTLEVAVKPRTYRRKARKHYLSLAKKKHKTRKQIHKALGQQLRYLRRNIKHVNTLLDKVPSGPIPLKYRDLKIFWVIQHIYDQQIQMYRNHTHSIEHRIVNIYQPYVRPIVRGKDNAQVEFGAKLGVSMHEGFNRLNHLSWDAYNESTDLKNQVEKYKELNGYYPEAIVADTIYGTRENRQWLKERDIRFSGKALGRPPKEPLSPYQKRKRRREQGMRNQIEGKFGQGKNAYDLNRVRTRTARTSESWIACIMFLMNLIKFSQVFLSFFKKWIQKIFSNRFIADFDQLARKFQYGAEWIYSPNPK